VNWTKILDVERAVSLAVNRTGDPPVAFWGVLISANTFRQGLDGWEEHPDYPATSIARVTDPYWYGGYSLQITDGSASPAAGTTTMARRRSQPIPRGSVGFQVIWQYEDEANTSEVLFRLRLTTGSYLKQAALRYDVANRLWQGLDENGNWVDLKEQDLQAGIWHRLSLNIYTGRFDEEIITYLNAESDWDMLISYFSKRLGGLAYAYATPSSERPCFSIEIGSTNAAAAASTVYIDNAIVVWGQVLTYEEFLKFKMSLAQLVPDIGIGYIL